MLNTKSFSSKTRISFFVVLMTLLSVFFSIYSMIGKSIWYIELKGVIITVKKLQISANTYLIGITLWFSHRTIITIINGELAATASTQHKANAVFMIIISALMITLLLLWLFQSSRKKPSELNNKTEPKYLPMIVAPLLLVSMLSSSIGSIVGGDLSTTALLYIRISTALIILLALSGFIFLVYELIESLSKRYRNSS